MQGNNHPPHKAELDSLARQIRLRIEENDVCVVDEDALAFIWNSHEPEKGCDPSSHVRMHLENFAKTHGLEVHFSSFARAAIFRESH